MNGGILSLMLSFLLCLLFEILNYFFIVYVFYNFAGYMNHQGVDIQWQDQISMPHYEGKVCWLFWKVETYEPFSDSVCWGCNPKQEAINKLPFGIEVDMCVCEGNCWADYYAINVWVIIWLVAFVTLFFFAFLHIIKSSK